RLAHRRQQRVESPGLHRRQRDRRKPAVRAAERYQPAAENSQQPEGSVLMMRRMPRWIVATALASSLGVITTAGQQSQQPQQPAAPPPDQPIFRSSTRLIVTTVAVKDKDGKPIEG